MERNFQFLLIIEFYFIKMAIFHFYLLHSISFTRHRTDHYRRKKNKNEKADPGPTQKN